MKMYMEMKNSYAINGATDVRDRYQTEYIFSWNCRILWKKMNAEMGPKAWLMICIIIYAAITSMCDDVVVTDDTNCGNTGKCIQWVP